MNKQDDGCDIVAYDMDRDERASKRFRNTNKRDKQKHKKRTNKKGT